MTELKALLLACRICRRLIGLDGKPTQVVSDSDWQKIASFNDASDADQFASTHGWKTRTSGKPGDKNCEHTCPDCLNLPQDWGAGTVDQLLKEYIEGNYSSGYGPIIPVEVIRNA